MIDVGARVRRVLGRFAPGAPYEEVGTVIGRTLVGNLVVRWADGMVAPYVPTDLEAVDGDGATKEGR